MICRLCWTAFAAVMTVLTPSAFGGFCSTAADEPRHGFQFLAGFSPDSVTFFGTAPDRRLAIAGFGYEYRCRFSKRTSLNYSAGLLPAAILIQPDQVVSTPAGTARTIPGHAVYGFAMTPLGLVAEFARGRRLHPFAEITLGIIASTEPIPIKAPNATGLNFLFTLGGGVRWNVASRRAISFGYKFLHISNAGTTAFNPGVDNNVLYVGYSVLR